MNRETFKDIIVSLIPEFKPCVGFEQNSPWHIYDVMEHTIAALEECDSAADEITKIAVLFHDIGKPECYHEDEKGIGHFYGHGEKSAEIAFNVLGVMALNREMVEAVVELIKYHDVHFEENEPFMKRWIEKIGEIQLHRLFWVKRADIKAQNPVYMEDRLAKVERLEEMLIKIAESR